MCAGWVDGTMENGHAPQADNVGILAAEAYFPNSYVSLRRRVSPPAALSRWQGTGFRQTAGPGTSFDATSAELIKMVQKWLAWGPGARVMGLGEVHHSCCM
jgi:hypothetical protein